MSLLPGWLSGRTSDGGAWEPRGSWGFYRSSIRDYMDRVILKTPWGTLRLHWILRADHGEDYHDHPFDFTSMIVKGGYVEELLTLRTARTIRSSVVQRDRWSVSRRRAEDSHRIISVKPGTVTLVLSGPKRKSWGFITSNGWIHHSSWRGVR